MQLKIKKLHPAAKLPTYASRFRNAEKGRDKP